MAKKIIIGNWKMNPALKKDAEKLFKEIKKVSAGIKSDAVICAPFIYLDALKKIGTSARISLGAQDVSHADAGAVTGDVSAKMLQSLGVKYIIVGHSERRALGDTDALINQKIKQCLKHKITPVVCVGEHERDADHQYLKVIAEQITQALSGIPKTNVANIIIAYEPVWALTTTLNRHDETPEDCEEMLIYIRKVLTDAFGAAAAKSVRMIYGGSANPENASGFLSIGKDDGLLPGKASLNSKQFGEILKICDQLKK